ncbi:hypothetical protein LNO36_19385 [Klebsiella variicola subsp. variicola]|nr:hypothetical protein [Klebsiella variicola subsp. variicola]
MKQRELRLERDPGCPVCGEHPSIHALIDYEEFCGLKPDESEAPIESVTALELHAWIEEGKPLQLIDIREPHERAIAKFPQAKVMPLGQIVRRIDEFDPTVDAVFLCKIGQRSIFRHSGTPARRLSGARDEFKRWPKRLGAGCRYPFTAVLTFSSTLSNTKDLSWQNKKALMHWGVKPRIS